MMARPLRISNNKKRRVREMVKEAGQALSLGRRDVCEKVCSRIEAIWPDNPDTMNIRGVLASWDNDNEKAEEYFVRAFNAVPRRFEFCKNLATHYARRNKLLDAARLFRHAVALKPSSLSAMLGLAWVLIKLREFDEAHDVIEKARRRHPNNIDLLMESFFLHDYSGCYPQAVACLDKVLEAVPNHEQAIYQKARMLRSSGQLASAEVMVRKLLALNPAHADAGALLASLKSFGAHDKDVALLRGIYEQSEPGSVDRQHMCFALGKVMEDLRDFDSAFAYFEEGNAIRHKTSRYDADAELAHMQEIMQHYTSDVFTRNSQLMDETPVFIVGMPRCGSTLVEQILAAHPDVASRGEWVSLEGVLATKHTKEDPLTLERMIAFAPSEWHEVGRAFLEQLKRPFHAVQRITDKTLINIRLIGAIHCALPGARIIHVRRHPLDTCWSIYKSDFEGFLFDYAYSLGELAYYYRMYLRLMQHWRDVLPRGVMYEVDYEQLVSHQEEETSKLLDACGLAWDENCLTFQEAGNRVRTLSAVQVRQSLYTDSVGRWKQYEAYLQPLIKILGSEAA